MNKQGFAGTWLIVVIVVLIIAGGYFILVPKQPTVAPSTDQEPSSTITEISGVKTYTNPQFGFQVQFPKDFVFNDAQPQTPTWSLVKLHANRVIRPIDCGGFTKAKDELIFSWTILDSTSSAAEPVISRANKPPYIGLHIGSKNMSIYRDIPGMCESGDEIIWIEPSGKYVVLFEVDPSYTILDYSRIIDSFNFVAR